MMQGDALRADVSTHEKRMSAISIATASMSKSQSSLMLTCAVCVAALFSSCLHQRRGCWTGTNSNDKSDKKASDL
jgi:hypothetical protein